MTDFEGDTKTVTHDKLAEDWAWLVGLEKDCSNTVYHNRIAEGIYSSYWSSCDECDGSGQVPAQEEVRP